MAVIVFFVKICKCWYLNIYKFSPQGKRSRSDSAAPTARYLGHVRSSRRAECQHLLERIHREDLPDRLDRNVLEHHGKNISSISSQLRMRPDDFQRWHLPQRRRSSKQHRMLCRVESEFQESASVSAWTKNQSQSSQRQGLPIIGHSVATGEYYFFGMH